MPLDLPLRCRCGHVRGMAREVSPSTGFRFICYCKDCEAFARFLDRADVLDAAGGTDIFQMPPGRVTLAAGTDAVRCLRLRGTGVFRWYADCCRTPIANTAGPGFPGGRSDPFFHRSRLHEPPCGRPSPGRGVRPAALPNLRTLRRRATVVVVGAAAVVRSLRPPRRENARLADARARSADPVLRRAYQRSVFPAARAHARRTGRP
jgi:hypothetical protein